MRNVALVLFAFATIVVNADACERCGLFGRKCRYYSSEHVEHIDKHYDGSTDVFVIQNNNPSPLVGQGYTQYSSTGGYQSLVFPLLDPNAYFSQEQELIKAAQEAAAARTQRSLELFGKVAELQSPIAEKLATGQAAKMILEASGLQGAESTNHAAIVINRDQYGRVVIAQLSQEQISQLNAHVADKAGDAAKSSGGDKYPSLTQFCGQCHGISVAQPKASLHLGDDANVAKTMKAKFFEIESAIADKKMPPASAKQPTDVERLAIVREIKTLISSYSE